MDLKVDPDVPDDDAPAGPGADVWLSFAASLSGVQAELAAARDQRERLIRAVRPIKVTLPAITTAAGLLDLPDIMGPRDGYVWDVHIVALNTAMTGGTVTMLSGGGGTQEFVFTAAGLLQYGKGQLMLMPRDRLTFQAAGLTGNAQFCLRGTQLEVGLVAEYLL